MTGGTGKQRHPTHEGAADAENMDMHEDSGRARNE
jgi:hypothetical protein